MEAVVLERLRSAVASAGPGLPGGRWELKEPAMCTALGFLPEPAWGPVLAFAAELVWARDPVPYEAWIKGGKVWLDDGQGGGPRRLDCSGSARELALQPRSLLFLDGDILVAEAPKRGRAFLVGVLDWRAWGNLLAVRRKGTGDLFFFDLRRLASRDRGMFLRDIAEMEEEVQRSIGLLAHVRDLPSRPTELPLEDALSPPEHRRHMVEELCRLALSRVGAARSPAEAAAPDLLAARGHAEPSHLPLRAATAAAPGGERDAVRARGAAHGRRSPHAARLRQQRVLAASV